MRHLFLALACFLSVGLPTSLAAESAAPAASTLSESAGAAQSKLKALLSGGQAEEFLPPDQAFKVRARARDSATILVDFTPAQSYYLYRNKFKFALAPERAGAVESVRLPPGEMKQDPIFGKTEVYHQPLQAVVTLDSGSAGAPELTLAASYQGCSDKGVCYPPETKQFTISLANLSPPDAARAGEASASSAATVDAEPGESARIDALLRGGRSWLTLLAFFGFGIGLAFTPCVLPMMPIVSSLIVGQGAAANRGRLLALTIAYVFGMAVTYALAGIAAGLSGALISSALQNAWVLGAFALVIVLLALSMFGFYELQLPAALQTRLSASAGRTSGGGLAGVAAMGALSALIVSPCVAAPLAGALLYISQTRDVILGGASLFSLALGMGVPLILIGVSAGTLLPKAGAWMESVKKFFGVLLLGLAIWIVSPVLPAMAVMLAWSALLIVAAMFLRAYERLPADATPALRLSRAAGVLALVAGIVFGVGAFRGATDPLDPLAMRATGASQDRFDPKFERVAGSNDLDAKLAAANGKFVMLDFYADWCVSCKEMERFTFADPTVRSRLDNIVLLQADVTANSAADKELLRRFNLFGPPAILFFDPSGREIGARRVYGYQPARTFLVGLDNICGTTC